jgi:hypothetical protein
VLRHPREKIKPNVATVRHGRWNALKVLLQCPIRRVLVQVDGPRIWKWFDVRTFDKRKQHRGIGNDRFRASRRRAMRIRIEEGSSLKAEVPSALVLRVNEKDVRRLVWEGQGHSITRRTYRRTQPGTNKKAHYLK